MIEYEMMGHVCIPLGNSFNRSEMQVQDSSQEGEKVVETDIQHSSLHQTKYR